MVNSCAAYRCSSRYVKGGSKSFHKFPIKNSELCKRWIVALKRENFIPTKYTCVCSDHFLEAGYNYCIPDKNILSVDHHYKPILKLNAVPSVFVFSANTQKPKRKLLTIRTLPTIDPLSKRKKVEVYPAINDTDKENSLTHNYQPENTTHSTDQTNQSSTLPVRSISPTKEKFKKKSKLYSKS